MISRGNAIRTLRIVASFAMLGTVTFGAVLGHTDFAPHAHLAGAGLGAVAGIAIKALHLV